MPWLDEGPYHLVYIYSMRIKIRQITRTHSCDCMFSRMVLDCLHETHASCFEYRTYKRDWSNKLTFSDLLIFSPTSGDSDWYTRFDFFFASSISKLSTSSSSFTLNGELTKHKPDLRPMLYHIQTQTFNKQANQNYLFSSYTLHTKQSHACNLKKSIRKHTIPLHKTNSLPTKSSS